MKDKNKIAIITLLGLTVLSAIVSKYLHVNLNWLTFIILGLSIFKFIIVAFQFMELKKAHVTWKVLIIGYLFIFITSITLIL
jgi:hypothetical protein